MNHHSMQACPNSRNAKASFLSLAPFTSATRISAPGSRPLTRLALSLCSVMAAMLLMPALHAAVKDDVFLQDVSIKHRLSPDLEGAQFLNLALNRDGVVFVLTDRGAARLFEGPDVLALDRSFRPLQGLKPRDLIEESGNVYYLYDDHYLSNDESGEPFVPVPKDEYRYFNLGDQSTAVLVGSSQVRRMFQGRIVDVEGVKGEVISRPASWRNEFYLNTGTKILQLLGNRAKLFHDAQEPITCLSTRNMEMLIGTTNGYYSISLGDGKKMLQRQTHIPGLHITCITPVEGGELWVGTTQGAFRVRRGGEINYYASKRWLRDDSVKAIQRAPDGQVHILTQTGLNTIKFIPMTLAEKAAGMDRKIRQRHIRYGLLAELRLAVPGDPSSAEMIDTDNDGTWSSYYLASQAFRFGATSDPEARSNVWQTFAALERLQKLPNLKGFPARTFERKGFKYSDVDRWRDARDGNWEWKGHTSSDEIAAQTFAHAVVYEVATRNPTERERVSRNFEKIAQHIVDNKLQLIDVDGKPTLWGRWNPEYVNGYAPSVIDRRLNSAQMIAILQLAHKMTGKESFKKKAFELLTTQGYLQNITNSVTQIAPTPHQIHEGIDMGNEWNHSDDLLSFVTYWVLYRYAFNAELRNLYSKAIADHWELEKNERNPLWNFIYGSLDVPRYDLEGALWTLRRFPTDLIVWDVHNSHRSDITKLPENFRHQQLAQLLPPSERVMTRWNAHPFILDGGTGGTIELAGDEFLLPYWMGRFLRIIR